MKKSLFYCLVALLLISSFVLAAEDDNSAGNTPAQINNLSSDLSSTDVKGKTNDLLSKEIQLPENYQIWARIFFGLKSENPASIQIFIVLICVWISILIILHALMGFFPGLREGFKGWVLAVALNIFFATVGTTKVAADFFFDLGNFFGYLEGWSLLTLALTIIIVLVVLYGVQKFVKHIQNRAGWETARNVGRNIAMVNAEGRAISESL